MSGSVGPRPRKQWQIQDGPRGLLRLLRGQLAEDGCIESQVVIAKHLLDEAQDGGDWTESTAQAVHWLTRAAEYGNEEAAGLLASCFKSGTGITQENYERVKDCLSMSRDEKAFRASARELFSALTPFGQEFVTTCQLKQRISGAEGPVAAGRAGASDNADETTQKDEADSSFSKWYEDAGMFDGQHLSEERLAEIAAKVSRGYLPHESLGKDESPEPSRPSKVIRKRIFTKLKERWTSSSGKVLDWTARYGDRFLLSLLPLNQLRTFALLLFCTLMPLETVAYVLPLIFFYAALAVMLVSTLQILRNRKRFDTFVQWLQIFASASGCDLHTRCAEVKFCYRRLRPYVHFFVALLVLLSAYPLSSEAAVPHSELVALFAALSSLCLVGCNLSGPLIWGFAAGSGFLTMIRSIHACDAADQFPQLMFLDLKVVVFDQLSLSVSLASLTACVLLATCLKMASSESWHGSYKVLLPNLVALAWMQLIVVIAPKSTPWGVFRGAVFCGSAVALPVVFVVALPFILFYALQWIAGFLRGSTDPLWLMTTLASLAAAAAGKWFVDQRDRLGKGLLKKCLTGIQVACGVFAVVQLLPWIGNLEIAAPGSSTPAAVIDWQTYHSLCHTPAWNELTMAIVQERCGHLTGAQVKWGGQVKAVKIVKTTNRLEELLGFLPTAVGQRLRCVYGAPYEDCDREAMAEHEFKLCSLAKLVAHECQVKQWNQHEFEVSVQMSGGYWNSADVVLVADNSFADFVLHLNAGDEIRFSGLLRANVGTWQPKISLQTVSCENCVNDMEPAVGRQKVDLSDEIQAVCNFVFNYFFYPFVELKHGDNLT